MTTAQTSRPPAAILIAEDSRTQAARLKLLLEDSGHQVTVAGNGREALAAARKDKPWLVITDVVMPEMDGYELCRQIKADDTLRHTPVVLLTSLSGPEEVVRALKCGADNFMRKPYDDKRLVSTVEYIFANRQIRDKERMKLGVEVDLGGERYLITSERQQILDLLLSSFMEAVELNRELQVKQQELALLAANLETKVEERTAELQKSARQIHELQKFEAIGRLAGGVAHDFNNHLGIILGYAERTMKDLSPADATLAANVQMIRDASLKAASLTHQLLAFSRRQVIEPKAVDLNRNVTELGKLLQPLLGDNIELISRLEPALWEVRADPAQIDQVVMNLAVNARDAMPNGGTLEIKTANVEFRKGETTLPAGVLPGSYVMLEVSDTGTGMDKEVLSHIFEPFFTTKGEGKGTGLGLATLYGIVSQSGGGLRVNSEVGQGTAFQIYLPRLHSSAHLGVAETSAISAARGSETVLAVEDVKILRELACDSLRDAGYTVLEAGSGREALELARQHSGPIHLLLTDSAMPGMSGRELAEQLRRLRPEINILYVSGFMDDSVLLDGILTPGTAFLEKPFTQDVLVRKVREVLEHARE